MPAYGGQVQPEYSVCGRQTLCNSFSETEARFLLIMHAFHVTVKLEDAVREVRAGQENATIQGGGYGDVSLIASTHSLRRCDKLLHRVTARKVSFSDL
jgi:hypothetical protein